jgi:hypothetical protein
MYIGIVASAKVTFEVPSELRALMDRHPEVNWSAVFREALVRHARALDIAKRILEEEEDERIVRMTERLRRGAAVRFRKATHARRA